MTKSRYAMMCSINDCMTLLSAWCIELVMLQSGKLLVAIQFPSVVYAPKYKLRM